MQKPRAAPLDAGGALEALCPLLFLAEDENSEKPKQLANDVFTLDAQVTFSKSTKYYLIDQVHKYTYPVDQLEDHSTVS